MVLPHDPIFSEKHEGVLARSCGAFLAPVIQAQIARSPTPSIFLSVIDAMKAALSYAASVRENIRMGFIDWRSKLIQRIGVVCSALREVGIYGLVSKMRWWIAFNREYREWCHKRAGLGSVPGLYSAPLNDGQSDHPFFSILMPVKDPAPDVLEKALASVRCQSWRDWELCVADDASACPEVRALLSAHALADPRIRVVWRESSGHIARATNSALEIATGQYVVLMDHDDELSLDALATAYREIVSHEFPALLFSDVDKIAPSGAYFSPYLKPGWNPELMRGQNLVSHLGIYRADLLRLVGGFRPGYEGSQDWDLALRVSEELTPDQMVHIPEVLYHWRMTAGSTAISISGKHYAKDAARKAVDEHLTRSGISADVLVEPDGCLRITYLLGANRTVKCIPVPHGARASDLNARARESTEDVLVFHAEGIHPLPVDWYGALAARCLQPGTGAVGAKVLSPCGEVAHAGAVLHERWGYRLPYRGVNGRERGYINHLRLGRNVAALSAACLVVSKENFDSVGGFDTSHFDQAYYDIDFCLRLSQRGLWSVWLPEPVLVLTDGDWPDGESLGKRFPNELALFLAQWSGILKQGMFIHPLLDPDARWPGFRKQAFGERH